MHKDLLITLLKNPYVTSQSDTQLLVELTKKYPYFHSAFTLLLINLQKTNSNLFDTYLHDSSLKITDRKHLFNLLHKVGQADNLIQTENALEDSPVEIEFPKKTTTKFQEVENSIVDTDIENIVSLDNNLLEIDESMPIGEKTADEVDSESTAFEVNSEETPAVEKNTLEFDQKTIIERFIDESPSFAPRKLEPAQENPDISLDSIKEDDTIVSETLANIFEMQKLYDKAIDVYQKLILKFPEKSAYFASRIETLKKIVK